MAVETRAVCVISTAHLTPATCAVLNGPREAWPIYGGAIGCHGDGFLIHASDPAEEHPADLAAVVAWAKALGFDYLIVDVDGEPVDDLPTYDHD